MTITTITTERLREIASTPSFSSTPLSHEIKYMARELLAAREAVPVVEPDYIRRDCGCCGFESLNYFQDDAACPKCNHKPLGKTELFTAPPAPAVPDNVREALTLALQAMEFMGDTLNNMDATCTEDVEYVTPAFNAVRGLLAAAPNHSENTLGMVAMNNRRR